MPALDATACSELIEPLTEIAIRAAQAIRRIDPKRGVRMKPDGSPLTAADEAAEHVIRAELTRLLPALPVVSEEQADRSTSLEAAAAAQSYFLVDPLDGTREFIAGRDEYTVNIALMSAGAPIMGVTAAPALGLIWRGIVGHGAERVDQAETAGRRTLSAIHTRPRPARGLVVMVSRSHLEARTQAYLDALPVAELLRCGSALKFCRVAEGAADLYPRLAPTCDWDVAAGHAILAAAGGSVTAPDGSAVAYGTKALRIPGFLAWGEVPAP